VITVGNFFRAALPLTAVTLVFTAVAYFGFGEVAALVTAALIGGLLTGIHAGIAICVLVIAEPHRFPDSVQKLGTAVLMRRTGRIVR